MERTAVQLGSEQLRDWMRRRGFEYQAEVAGFLGIDKRFVSQYLNEQSRPGLMHALIIERKTGIPVEAWMGTELHEADEPVTAERRNSRVRKV